MHKTKLGHNLRPTVTCLQQQQQQQQNAHDQTIEAVGERIGGWHRHRATFQCMSLFRLCIEEVVSNAVGDQSRQ